MKKEIIDTAIEMTKNIPSTDSDVSENNSDNGTTCNKENVLAPLQLEEGDLTPYPQAEYMIVEAANMDKVVRDVNTQLQNGWQTEWGIQVVNTPTWTRYYQSMVRWNVDCGLEPEMPSENSEAGTMGPKPLYIPGLEDEPDLYEDINEDATDW